LAKFSERKFSERNVGKHAATAVRSTALLRRNAAARLSRFEKPGDDEGLTVNHCAARHFLAPKYGPAWSRGRGIVSAWCLG